MAVARSTEKGQIKNGFGEYLAIGDCSNDRYVGRGCAIPEWSPCRLIERGEGNGTAGTLDLGQDLVYLLTEPNYIKPLLMMSDETVDKGPMMLRESRFVQTALFNESGLQALVVSSLRKNHSLFLRWHCVRRSGFP